MKGQEAGVGGQEAGVKAEEAGAGDVDKGEQICQLLPPIFGVMGVILLLMYQFLMTQILAYNLISPVMRIVLHQSISRHFLMGK